MGRRIYENGNFIWKYVFGKQSSEMNRYADEFCIGVYLEEEEHYKDEDNNLQSWSIYKWKVKKSVDLEKLKKLYKQLSNGLTEKELDEIGTKAVKDFWNKQDDEYKETFKEYKNEIEITDKINDYKFGCVCINKKELDIDKIVFEAVEKKICCSCGFLFMTKRFIEYIEENDKETFEFEDEY